LASLISQDKKPKEKEKQKQKPTYFIVKQKNNKFNQWQPISYFDENNNFRGIAVFDTLLQAEE
jgi:hypothetical protein